MSQKWTVLSPNRLLTEVKQRFSSQYPVKQIKWLIEHNRCRVNGEIERFGSTRVQAGDKISLILENAPQFNCEPQRILYQDSTLLIYNKPAYLTSELLAAMTQTHLVHRLDRDTTGVILLVKDEQALIPLENQFRERIVQKEYIALVEGHVKEEEGTISGYMALAAQREGAAIWAMASKGKFSKTYWKKLHTENHCSWLKCVPVTGRTHQIRVHLKHLGHPLAGDCVYGSRRSKTGHLRPMLHARTLSFKHPASQEFLTFSASFPSDFGKMAFMANS